MNGTYKVSLMLTEQLGKFLSTDFLPTVIYTKTIEVNRFHQACTMKIIVNAKLIVNR